jgi:lysophospholipase L1-like esterase
MDGTPHGMGARVQGGSGGIGSVTKKKKIITVAILLGSVLIVTEIVLQSISEPIFYVDTLPALADCMEADSRVTHRLRRNLKQVRVKGTMGESPVEFAVSTNSLGLRSPEVSAKKDRFRILVLGDSCTFGLGVDNEGTYPARLERILNGDGSGDRRFEVINAGVPGYGTWQGARYLESRGLRLKPDLVIACFGNNDVAAHDDPNNINRLPSLLSGGFVQEKLMDLALYRTYLNARVELWNRWAARGARQAAPPSVSPIEAAYRANLSALIGTCRENRIPLMFMVWPLLPQVYPYAEQERLRLVPALEYCRSRIRNQSILREVARDAGIPLVDPLPAMSAARDRPIYFAVIHARPEGLEIIARVLAEAVRQDFCLSPASRPG